MAVMGRQEQALLVAEIPEIAAQLLARQQLGVHRLSIEAGLQLWQALVAVEDALRACGASEKESGEER
jgi:hypothetical protein